MITARREQRAGFALIAALMILLALGIMGAGMVSLYSSSAHAAVRKIDGVKAALLADSGIRWLVESQFKDNAGGNGPVFDFTGYTQDDSPTDAPFGTDSLVYGGGNVWFEYSNAAANSLEITATARVTSGGVDTDRVASVKMTAQQAPPMRKVIYSVGPVNLSGAIDNPDDDPGNPDGITGDIQCQSTVTMPSPAVLTYDSTKVKQNSSYQFGGVDQYAYVADGGMDEGFDGVPVIWKPGTYQHPTLGNTVGYVWRYGYAYNHLILDGGGGLVARWKFDNNASDSAGSNNGTLVGNAAFSTDVPPALSGSTHSLSLDGDGDYVTVPDNARLNIAVSFTVTAWVKRTPEENWNQIYDSGSSNGWVFEIEPSSLENNINYYVVNGNDYPAASDPINNSGVWYHVAVVKDGDAGTNVTLYVNGNVAGTAAAGAVSVSSGTKYIGTYDGGPAGATFPGKIDDLRIYSRALTLAEIQDIYAGNDGPLDTGGGGVINIYGTLGGSEGHNTRITTVNDPVVNWYAPDKDLWGGSTLDKCPLFDVWEARFTDDPATPQAGPVINLNGVAIIQSGGVLEVGPGTTLSLHGPVGPGNPGGVILCGGTVDMDAGPVSLTLTYDPQWNDPSLSVPWSNMSPEFELTDWKEEQSP